MQCKNILNYDKICFTPLIAFAAMAFVCSSDANVADRLVKLN